jgi:hypothetical protein
MYNMSVSCINDLHYGCNVLVDYMHVLHAQAIDTECT